MVSSSRKVVPLGALDESLDEAKDNDGLLGRIASEAMAFDSTESEQFGHGESIQMIEYSVTADQSCQRLYGPYVPVFGSNFTFTSAKTIAIFMATTTLLLPLLQKLNR